MNQCNHPIIEGGPNECPYCQPIPTQAPLDKVIAVGFGTAIVTCDGQTMLDGENLDDDYANRFGDDDGWIRFKDAEDLAALDPEHDWRVVLHGPLHGETYQRQGEGVWLCIERNEGFA